MEGKSLKDELYEYFDYDTPSNSSFNQRRTQILPEAFEFLFRGVNETVPRKNVMYKDYQLIACDGSDV